VREEVLQEEDAGYDAATRFCLDWFQAFGIANGKSGDADLMARAYDIGLGDLERAGVFRARGGEAHLLSRAGMPEDWDPRTDKLLTHWEACHHLIRVLTSGDGGELAAARLLALLGSDTAETVRTLAYRLYDICEKKGWADEARAYNVLAEEWPHLEAASIGFRTGSKPTQGVLDLAQAAVR
jgi:putative DNA methylase